MMSSSRQRRGFNVCTLTSDKAPRYNVKSTLVTCSGTDYIFLFGGFDDNDNLDSNVYLLNMKTKTWECDDKHKGVFREGHSAIYIGKGNVFVFGGIPFDEFPDLSLSRRTRTRNASNNNGHLLSGDNDDSNDNDDINEYDNDDNDNNNDDYDDDEADAMDGLVFHKDSPMLIYNIPDRKWISAPKFALSSAPTPRSRHACCLSQDGTKIYISGGLVNSTPLSDLYCYDLVSGLWHGPINFAARFDHFITVHDGKLYSFGGLDKDMNHVTSSIIYFNFSDQSIGEISLLSHPNYNWKWQNLDDDDDDENARLYNQSNDEPYIPTNSERVYLNCALNSSLKVDISLPSWGFENNNKGIAIAYHDLDEMRYMPLVNSKNINSDLRQNSLHNVNDYAWKHAFVSDDGSLCLLGFDKTNRESTADTIRTSNDSHLVTLLDVELAGLGIPTVLESKGDKRLQVGSVNLVNDFKNFLISEEFTDFEIYTFKNDDLKHQYSDVEDINDLAEAAMTSEGSLTKEHDFFTKIKIHKSILIARWPHFRRMISSGMHETKSNKMFIPEPYISVKALIFYLYTGTIDFDHYIPAADFGIIDYSGLLILSNLYELADLRAQILFQLFRELNILISANDTNMNPEYKIELILKVWANSLISNECVFVSKVLDVIKSNWSTITRSKAFMGLPKHLIIRLCQDCSDEVATMQKQALITNKNSFESLLSTPSTPSHGPSQMWRNTHSNSPFLRTARDEPSPSLQDRVALDNTHASPFPALQYFSTQSADYARPS